MEAGAGGRRSRSELSRHAAVTTRALNRSEFRPFLCTSFGTGRTRCRAAGCCEKRTDLLTSQPCVCDLSFASALVLFRYPCRSASLGSGAQHGGEARARLGDPLSLAPAVRVCDGVTACPPCAELPTSAAVLKAGNVYVPRFETAGRPHLPEGVVPSLRQPRRPSALFPPPPPLPVLTVGRRPVNAPGPQQAPVTGTPAPQADGEQATPAPCSGAHGSASRGPAADSSRRRFRSLDFPLMGSGRFLPLCSRGCVTIPPISASGRARPSALTAPAARRRHPTCPG